MREHIADKAFVFRYIKNHYNSIRKINLKNTVIPVEKKCQETSTDFFFKRDTLSQ